MLRKFRAKILIFSVVLIIAVVLVINYTKHSLPPSPVVPKSDFHSPKLPVHIPTPQIDRPVKKDGVDLHQVVYDMNISQKVHNAAKFGPPPLNGVVAVVQVHSRLNFMQQLLESLKKAKGIDQVTLVISMDKYDKKLMEMIDDIDFCRFIKIFFPFSMQLYPDTFPGEDPNDCPRDLPRNEALKRKCNNAEYPDMHNHYREVKFVQIKHHWLWKLHTVFNSLEAIAGTDSTILLLEEDYYVLPDVFDVLKLSLKIMSKSCPDCKTMSLGNYERTTDYSLESANAVVRSWVSSKNNIGMVITKKFYDQIVTCNDDFCSYDDYNWDWTLQGIAPTCMGGHFAGLFLQASRVLHLGSCDGIHTPAKTNSCKPDVLAAKALKNIAETNLFPDNLVVTSKMVRPASKPFMNGGWGDLRDHRLCKSYYNLSKSVAKTLIKG